MKYPKNYFLTHVGKAKNFSQIKKICPTCSLEFMVQYHRKDIAKFCSVGCKRHVVSLECRKRMSENMKGEKHWNFDKKATAETRKKQSDAHKGKRPNNYIGGYEYKLFVNKNRRVMKLGNGGSHTFEQWRALKERYNFICLCCKKFEPEITLSEDHIIPLSKGGRDDIENIQPLCRSCNSRKHAKTIQYEL